MGYHPEIILAGRRINENMSAYIGTEIVKNLLKYSVSSEKFRIALFGVTFKENIKDIRNSKIVELFNHLSKFGIETSIYDPVANKEEVYKEYKIKLIDYKDINDIDGAVFCVAHDEFKQISLAELKTRFKNNNPYIFDIKGIFNKELVENNGYRYWRL
jgi:UDP-N-acetyl-D-galactosamine dehydrogenase